MIINKEEVEEFIKNLLTGDFEDVHIDYGARKGIKFAEEKFNEFFMDIICENQGLKLYKDNEVERFKELAVEFAEFIIDYEKTPHLNRLETTEELYELFLKQRNEKN